MKLENKVAIVTGGGQGIGRGIVLCLAEEGADIAIIEINPDTAQKVAAEVEQMGRRARAIVADATDNDSIVKSVREVIDYFGNIDIRAGIFDSCLFIGLSGSFPVHGKSGPVKFRLKVGKHLIDGKADAFQVNRI